MSVQATVFALFLAIIVSCPGSETANITAFITNASSPSYAVEGLSFTLEWTYILDGTIGFVQFSIITGIGSESLMGKKFGPGVIALQRDYQARFRAQATNTRAELKILAVQRSDETTYRVNVSPTGTGGLSQLVAVIVNFQPDITEISGNQTVIEGGNVTLKCLADGKPKPNITWTRLPDNSVVNVALTSIRRQDAGKYRCSADNGIGRSAIKDVCIFVQYPPEVNGTGQNGTVAEGDKHTFSCPVAGNPEPRIEWYDKTGKKIFSGKQYKTGESGCYTCVANNSIGTSVNVTQCLKKINASLTTIPPSTVSPGEKVKAKIKARIKIEREYQGNNQEFVLWFTKEMDKIYENMPDYKRTLVIKTDLRPGSIIVCFILHFTTLVTPEEGLEKLNATLVLNRKFGGFKAEDLALVLGESTTSTAPGSPNPTAGPPWAIIGAVAGGVVLLTSLLGVLTWWVYKKRKCRKDSKIHNADPGRHDNEGGYSQVQGAYAQSGPPAANGTDGAAEQEIEAAAAAAAAIPTYAVVDKSKKSKKQADEKPPEYAVGDKSTKKEKQEVAIIPTYAAVDKSKKKKKSREEVPAVYAEVDKSKKKKKKKIDDKNLYENLDEPKKEKKPGELLYADLGEFQNPSMPTVSISPQPLPAIKKADPYERTDYADITQFLKGNATLPPNDSNGDTEMKPKRPSKKKEIQGNDKETPI